MGDKKFFLLLYDVCTIVDTPTYIAYIKTWTSFPINSYCLDRIGIETNGERGHTVMNIDIS